jgi:hypothetical protein
MRLCLYTPLLTPFARDDLPIAFPARRCAELARRPKSRQPLFGRGVTAPNMDLRTSEAQTEGTLQTPLTPWHIFGPTFELPLLQ